MKESYKKLILKILLVFDIIFSILINTISFFTWVTSMIFTSDIPVTMKNSEAKGIIITLIILTLVYLIYLIKSKCNIANIGQTFGVLFLWGITLFGELKYNYSYNSKLVSIIGFVLTLVPFIYILFKFWKKYKLKISINN